MSNNYPFKLLEVECQICLIEMEQSSVLKLSCGHFFHKCCIEEWIDCQKKKGRRSTCPSCRQIITKEKELSTNLCCFGFLSRFRNR